MWIVSKVVGGILSALSAISLVFTVEWSIWSSPMIVNEVIESELNFSLFYPWLILLINIVVFLLSLKLVKHSDLNEQSWKRRLNYVMDRTNQRVIIFTNGEEVGESDWSDIHFEKTRTFTHRYTHCAEISWVSKSQGASVYKSIISDNLFESWESFHQSFMDESQPLPDIPVLERYRKFDAETSQYDISTNRPERFWRTITDELWRFISKKPELLNRVLKQDVFDEINIKPTSGFTGYFSDEWYRTEGRSVVWGIFVFLILQLGITSLIFYPKLATEARSAELLAYTASGKAQIEIEEFDDGSFAEIIVLTVNEKRFPKRSTDLYGYENAWSMGPEGLSRKTEVDVSYDPENPQNFRLKVFEPKNSNVLKLKIHIVLIVLHILFVNYILLRYLIDSKRSSWRYRTYKHKLM